MTRGEKNLRWPVEDRSCWRAICDRLRPGKYEQAAELLYQIQVANEQTGDATMAYVLDVAHWICLACNQCRDEVEWHQRAYKETIQRERELRQQIYKIIYMESL